MGGDLQPPPALALENVDSEDEDQQPAKVNPSGAVFGVYRGPPLHIHKPPNKICEYLDRMFKVYERGSCVMTEVRAGCVLFMTSAYILFLNPLILSGGSAGFNTGMPREDIALATAVSTGIATTLMAIFGNYPWVVSVQLGTNSYFVNDVLKIYVPCGAHSHFYGTNATCKGLPCSCSFVNGTQVVNEVVDPTSACFGSNNACYGTKIPFEQGLAATFIEGMVFLAICVLGLREYILKLIPKSVLMAGSAGIGVFISFVGIKSMGMITAATYPTLLSLNLGWPYGTNGWGPSASPNPPTFDDCVMWFEGPPYTVVCPWLSVGGLIFTTILLMWNVHGAFIIGIFFTMFISWIKFPESIEDGGLVPTKVASVPSFAVTAGALDFDWGDNTSDLVTAFITFLYLDFIGSSITFVAMGQMMGIIDDKGNMPRANMAFISDATGSWVGALLGSSALTTYVESASAVREGGRTGLTAIVCSLFFFASIFLTPLFSVIPDIATGPILALIGLLIFMSSILEIDWNDITEAGPAYVTILGMPFTSNIAYGVIGGVFAYVVIKLFTYRLFPKWPLHQRKWPGRKIYRKWTGGDGHVSMFMRVPGWNMDVGPEGPRLPPVPIYLDWSLSTILKRYVLPRYGYVDKVNASKPHQASGTPDGMDKFADESTHHERNKSSSSGATPPGERSMA